MLCGAVFFVGYTDLLTFYKFMTVIVT